MHPYNVNNIIHSSAVVSRELSQHKQKFKKVLQNELGKLPGIIATGVKKTKKKQNAFQSCNTTSWETTYYLKVNHIFNNS